MAKKSFSLSRVYRLLEPGPVVMVAMNLIYAASAYLFGKLSDGASHSRLLMLGLAVLIAADLVLATDDHWVTVLLTGALMAEHQAEQLAAMAEDSI